MMRVAVIDFSKSSLSLLVAEVNENRSIESLFSTYTPLQLGEYIKDKKLSQRGIDKVIECARKLIDTSAYFKAERLYALSTTLLRKIDNKDKIKKEIKNKISLTLINLDERKEALALFSANEKYCILPSSLLISIGGNSTELCNLQDKNGENMHSLPFGSAMLSREYVKDVYPDKKEEKKISSLVRKQIKDIPLAFENAVLSGDNLYSIYKIYADYYQLLPQSEMMMQMSKLEKLDQVLSDKKKRSPMIIRNAPDRMHMVIPTYIALMEILKKAGVTTMIISTSGVKEGFLKEIISSGLDAKYLDLKDMKNEGKR